ncbi:MAG: 23S rRNA (uracil(1939)-C(5))-methyltransferase RlmD [bacterium]|jgi:23S rRNA (uracil1939-C5)-methyltransferase|nr:23S rRNA (uracil(1939)-C(5))-methyltransferase RlmD [candidate division KSB1 bacterium]MDH7559962.1 23S rRNA (uracil(1939)-C(5))-methyltransferase RlmD [bacterium]
MSLEKGAEIEVQVLSLAFGGKGVARVNDLVVFVEGGLPEQIVRVHITRRKRTFAEARIVEVVRQSPLATAPRCLHFPDCGGCQLQHLRYGAQLEVKRQHVVDCLERLGGIQSPPVTPALLSPQQFFYRNKMEFAFSDRAWVPAARLSQEGNREAGLYLGLHPRGRFDAVVDVSECHLLSPVSNQILAEIRQIARRSGLPAYSAASRQGFWRHAVIREGKQTGQVMVNIVTSAFDETALKTLSVGLRERFPAIVSVVATVSTSPANVAYGEQQVVLAGQPAIEEQLGRYRFEISANSFFQSNPQQALRLYEVVRRYASLRGDEVVFDLYCGTGTISIFLAEKAREVWGFELAGEAVADARRNCARNAIGNCHFVSGDVRTSLEKMAAEAGNIRTEVVVVDPPRAGVHPRVLEVLAEMAPRRIVYVSCNPATLARDLGVLCQGGYRLREVTPVDMFPQTWHVEAVALLEKESGQEKGIP